VIIVYPVAGLQIDQSAIIIKGKMLLQEEN
jgi:hypothetical protein